ncbi:MAG TPA: DUF5681 domain-containing protein [Stellaceae bacterium]|nr:DUF5681 domain-containing protein [Stellaceae bacterium]
MRICGAHVKPGQSGNPGGRPKGWAEVNALARQHTAAAIEALVKSLSDRRSEALERLSCDELEQLCTLYERMGIGLEGAERSADAEANVVPLKAPRAAEEVAADVGEPSAAPPSIPAPASSPAPPAPVLPSAPATSPAATIAPVTEGYVGRVAPVVRARSGFYMSARMRRGRRDIEKARMALAGGY